MARLAKAWPCLASAVLAVGLWFASARARRDDAALRAFALHTALLLVVSIVGLEPWLRWRAREAAAHPIAPAYSFQAAQADVRGAGDAGSSERNAGGGDGPNAPSCAGAGRCGVAARMDDLAGDGVGHGRWPSACARSCEQYGR